ncbi:MAG: EAL domain-containing protein [Bacilli bacterium]|nr:EAL domain-containing protein [Bacilli bacterium]
MGETSKKYFLESALEHIPGGFLIYRADDDKEEILFANKALIRMFDCSTYEEFMEYVHGSFKGIVSENDLDDVERQISIQIKSGTDAFDHIYYHIVTKCGDVKYIEDYGHHVVDREEGPLFYVYLVDSDQKLLAYDVDQVTHLPGPRRLREYSHKTIQIMGKSGYAPTYAYIYCNIAHFKRFNIRYGLKAGDKLLRDVSVILSSAFPNTMVSRMGDTDFAVFTEADQIEERIKGLNKTLRSQYGYKDVSIKAGAYVIGKEDYDSLDGALDNARKACHELDFKEDAFYKIYDDEMKRAQHIYNYVITNIDEAIKNGWIQPFFQPVIRTLSGTLCSAEALVRWIDPQFGLLSPKDLIKACEDSRQIHKLDEYMLQRICQMIRERIDKGLSVVPISFNLSRLDFMLMDFYKVVTDACRKYEIPHSALKIEITESLVAEDTEGIVEVCNKLRKDGFEIWMDDFGSGYSSLGTLQDYGFDEIKLDMSFLQNFNYDSKQIIKHMIALAKSLGIQTLCEGVETQEHFDFLKSIGCEKAQGYLFSRPLPFDDMLSLLELRGIKMEASRYSHFYNEISRINFTDNEPMSILKYDVPKNRFEVLFINQSLMDVLRFINIKSNADLERIINSDEIPFGQKIRSGRHLPDDVGAESTHFYTYMGHYLRVRSRNIASLEDQKMFVIYLNNLSAEEGKVQTELLETNIRHLYSIYDEVYSVDVNNDTMQTIASDLPSNITDAFKGLSYSEKVQKASLRGVFSEDRQLFLDFLNKDALLANVLNERSNYAVRPIRYLKEDGSLEWRLLFVILISNPDEGRFLIVTRRLTPSEMEGILSMKSIDDRYFEKLSSNDIMNSILISSDLSFFWKDKEGRFLGCTKAFLDRFGFKSQDDVIGKKEEELTWNITLKDHEEEESRVFKKGEIVSSIVGVRLHDGAPQNVASTSWPIYQGNTIIGLAGYLFDHDERTTSKDFERSLIDKDTGVLNSRGFLEGLLRYIDDSRKLNVPFSAITIRIRNMREIASLQGEHIASSVEKAVAKTLKLHFGKDSSISHIGFGNFAIIRSFLNEANSAKFSHEIVKDLEAIKSTEGVPVTLFVDSVAVNSEEAKNSPEEFNKLFIARLNGLNS